MKLDPVGKADPVKIVLAPRATLKKKLALLRHQCDLRRTPIARRDRLGLMDYANIVVTQDADKLLRRKMRAAS